MIDLTAKTILVTGGAGFLGSHIVDQLRSSNCRSVLAPTVGEYDLTRREDVELMFSDHRPQVVIHCAAVVGGIGANRATPGQFFYDNAMMGILVIEAARRYGVEKLVVLGTICAYPKYTAVPFREETLWDGYPEETNAPYGLAKKMLLVQCQAYRDQYGLNSIYLLPVNLYGPKDNFDLDTSHVIPALIRKCSSAVETGASEIVCWGDGTPTREFLYVEDAARGILQAAARYDKPEPVNLGSGKEISIRELAKRVAHLVGFTGTISWDTSKPNGQPRRSLDVSRAGKEFGFNATTGFDEGLRRTVDWYSSSRYIEAGCR